MQALHRQARTGARTAALLLSLGLGATVAQAQPGAKAIKINETAQVVPTAEVNLDLHIQPAILVRFPVPAGADRDRLEEDLQDRYNDILVDNEPLNRFIQPEDVVIYADPGLAPKRLAPKHTSKFHHASLRQPAIVAAPASYSIYVLGRRLLRVDEAMAVASGTATPHVLAVRWAKQLQQSLPLLCWRPPSQPEPHVAPDPPLRITTDLKQVGGGAGDVRLRGQKLFTLHGVQSGGKTAVDCADALNRHLAGLAARYGTTLAPDQLIQAQPDATHGSVTLWLGQSSIATITPADARANGAPSAQALADQWAAALRQAWHS